MSLLQQDEDIVTTRCRSLQQDEDIVCRCYNKMWISFVVVTTRSGYRLSLLQQDEDIVCRCYNKIRISFVVVTTR